MSASKSKIVLAIAAVACIGCCAIPLYAVVATASGFGVFAAAVSKAHWDVLICLLPLVMILVGYGLYKRHRINKSCCSEPKDNCGESKCSSK
jgi:hypothetical protein